MMLITALTIPVVCLAYTIHVPADYPTIQEGIDAAQNGDTVLIEPGTYNKEIDFKGKDITVRSRFGADSTIIDVKYRNTCQRRHLLQRRGTGFLARRIYDHEWKGNGSAGAS